MLLKNSQNNQNKDAEEALRHSTTVGKRFVMLLSHNKFCSLQSVTPFVPVLKYLNSKWPWNWTEKKEGKRSIKFYLFSSTVKVVSHHTEPYVNVNLFGCIWLCSVCGRKEVNKEGRFSGGGGSTVQTHRGATQGNECVQNKPSVCLFFGTFIDNADLMIKRTHKHTHTPWTCTYQPDKVNWLCNYTQDIFKNTILKNTQHAVWFSFS